MKPWTQFFSVLQLLVVAMSLCLIVYPAARATPLKFFLIALFAVVSVRIVGRWYRAGYLTSTPRDIAAAIRRGGVRTGPLDLLSSVLGAIAIVLSL
jgi:hypothetical protein